MSQEILSRIGAVELGQNQLNGRVALVEAEQKHSRELFDARLTTLSARFDSFQNALTAFSTKLDAISDKITASSSDLLSTPVGRELRDDIDRLKIQVDDNTDARLASEAVIHMFRWIGAPTLILIIVALVFLVGRVDHLW